MPILLRSSIRRLSDILLPMPTLLFINTSAFCSNKNEKSIHDADKLKWLSNAETRILEDLYLICHLGGKINLRIDSRTSCIHSSNIKEPRCFHNMLICGNFKPETSVGNFQKLNTKEMSRYKLLQWHKITSKKKNTYKTFSHLNGIVTSTFTHNMQKKS